MNLNEQLNNVKEEVLNMVTKTEADSKILQEEVKLLSQEFSTIKLQKNIFDIRKLQFQSHLQLDIKKMNELSDFMNAQLNELNKLYSIVHNELLKKHKWSASIKLEAEKAELKCNQIKAQLPDFWNTIKENVHKTEALLLEETSHWNALQKRFEEIEARKTRERMATENKEKIKLLQEEIAKGEKEYEHEMVEIEKLKQQYIELKTVNEQCNEMIKEDYVDKKKLYSIAKKIFKGEKSRFKSVERAVSELHLQFQECVFANPLSEIILKCQEKLHPNVNAESK